MADETPQAERQFALHRIYIKDASFESPNAPEVFRGDWQPKHELNLNTKVEKLGENEYEVVLTVTVTTKVGEKTACIVEVHQAGIFSILGFPDQELGTLLGAYCPNVLFPYAREAVSDLVTKGSFPQLVLQPVNFDALLAQHQQQKATEQQKSDAGTPTH